MNLSYKFADSPVGKLKLVASNLGLAAILWENDDPDRVRLDGSVLDENHPILTLAQAQLSNYFSGARSVFSVPLDSRGTPFQKQVWEALLGIPFGETRTYGEIATSLGMPSAARAVGSANRRNPISIVVPCHRVIGSSGQLTGFAGGLEAKAYLLALEGALPQGAMFRRQFPVANQTKNDEANSCLFCAGPDGMAERA